MLPDSGFKNDGAGVSVLPLRFLNVEKKSWSYCTIGYLKVVLAFEDPDIEMNSYTQKDMANCTFVGPIVPSFVRKMYDIYG